MAHLLPTFFNLSISMLYAIEKVREKERKMKHI